MRRISANYIFPVTSAPLKNGIIEIDDQGVIQNIIDTKGELVESRNLEFYNGAIIPGLVNTHCHLELSYLKNKIKPKRGLPKFLTDIVHIRKEYDQPNIDDSIAKFDKLMKQKGIVAVGDISNTNHTIRQKKHSDIFYHTFIEVIGLGNNTQEIFKNQLSIYDEFMGNGLPASVVPHAPYSVSKDLFLKIKNFSEENGSIVSMHNQESGDENNMFIDKTGAIVEALTALGIDLSSWYPSGKKSVVSIMNWLPQKNNILFVHNTYSTQEDINLIQENIPNAYWCLCPLSNMYIENKLPDFTLFNRFDNRVTIGTDSLASNHDLSILEEMKVVALNSKVEFSKLLQWATLNGAKALQVDSKYGSLEKDKSPGINLITSFDFQKMHLSENSQIKVLV